MWAFERYKWIRAFLHKTANLRKVMYFGARYGFFPIDSVVVRYTQVSPIKSTICATLSSRVSCVFISHTRVCKLHNLCYIINVRSLVAIFRSFTPNGRWYRFAPRVSQGNDISLRRQLQLWIRITIKIIHQFAWHPLRFVHLTVIAPRNVIYATLPFISFQEL